MLTAVYPLGIAFYLDEDAAKVQPTPDAVLGCQAILGAFSPTVRATTQRPLGRTRPDAEVLNTFLVSIKIVGFDNCVLDTKQHFA